MSLPPVHVLDRPDDDAGEAMAGEDLCDRFKQLAV
jgi:hypothetical protein